jgi:hypothetical protein
LRPLRQLGFVRDLTPIAFVRARNSTHFSFVEINSLKYKYTPGLAFVGYG